MTLDLRPDPIELECDPERVAQVLRILLDNALRHTPPGTGVRVSAARANGHVRLEVSDRGLGINRQNMPHIFEPFFTSNEQAQGAGLGLAIARELAERMQGRLTVRSGAGPDDLLAGASGVRRLALRAAPPLVALAGCGDKDKARAGRDPAKATTRVEVVESQGEGGFDAQKIYKAEAPGVVTIVSIFGGESGEGSGFVLERRRRDRHQRARRHHRRGRRRSSAPTQVYVEFADGNRVAAKVLGHDPNADVALLKVDPKGLTLRPLPLGDSEKVAGRRAGGGDRVAVRTGAVALGRDRVRRRPRGRLADAVPDLRRDPDRRRDQPRQLRRAAGRAPSGRVIGINQQIQSRSGGGEGVGFAVPIDVVKRSIGQLRESGTAQLRLPRA